MTRPVDALLRWFGGAACLAAGALLALGGPALGREDGARSLSGWELRSAVGLSTNFTCMSDGSSCADQESDSCPGCSTCSNQASGGAICVIQPYASCSSTPVSCGDKTTGTCCTCQESGSTICCFDDPTVEGTCGSIAQCL